MSEAYAQRFRRIIIEKKANKKKKMRNLESLTLKKKSILRLK